jgi:hypothetical protein
LTDPGGFGVEDEAGLYTGVKMRFLTPFVPEAQTVEVAALVTDTVLVSAVIVDVFNWRVTASVVTDIIFGLAMIVDVGTVVVTAFAVTTLVPVVTVVLTAVGAVEVMVVVVERVEICNQVEQKELAPG